MSLREFRLKIDAIKASVSLKETIERDGHKLARNGSLWKLCCPFHLERTPSCVIYPDQHFHCFGCHSRGDIFGYVMQRDGCDFTAAVAKLDSGLLPTHRRVIPRIVKKEPEVDPLVFEDMLDKWFSKDTRRRDDFAAKIGVSPGALSNLDVQWAQEHRAWAFPMRDHKRRTVGIRLRDENGRKWAVKGSRQGFFIPIDPAHWDIYITEGPTDCAAMLSMGLFAIGKAAAMQGPEEIIKFVTKNHVRRVIVIADNDNAGLKGARKLIDVCLVPCCELVLPAKDAREFYRNGGTKEMIVMLVRNAVWKHPSHA